VVDTFDRATRLRIMKAVRTARTDPEERLAVALRRLRLKFHRNDRRVLGRPDFTFRSARLAVFVDGDFWHGRAWFTTGTAPATNAPFWISKFVRNGERDRAVNARLRARGWSVLRVWGSEIRKAPHAAAQRVRSRLRRLARAGRPFPSLAPSAKRGR
jgi:DNA mismatch endonuclease (patch repair protein)